MTNDGNAAFILMALVDGKSEESIRAAARRPVNAQPAGLGMTGAEVTKAIAQARRRITAAAGWNRDEQLGLAFSRLQSIYAASKTSRERLACQKEINSLLGLQGADAATEGAILAAVRRHLEALKVAPDGTDVIELARLAVEKVVSSSGGIGDADRQVEAVRSHLSRLKLCDVAAPVSEMARLAVQRIVELSSDQNGKNV